MAELSAAPGAAPSEGQVGEEVQGGSNTQPAGSPAGAAPAAPSMPGEADPNAPPDARDKPRGVKARPIPEKSRPPGLPGVISRGPDELFPELPLRGEDGRFLSREQRQAGAEGEPPGEVPEGEKAAVPPPPPGTSQKFTFAGKEFKDQAEAEQNHRSLQGQFKHLNERATHGEKAAWAWKERADQLEAEISRLRGGAAAPSTPSPSGAQPAEVVDDPTTLPDIEQLIEGFDGEEFEAVAVQGGLPLAGKYLFEQALKTVLEKVVPRVRAGYDQALAPFQAQEGMRQLASNMERIIGQAASLVQEDGSPVFPELADPKEVVAIAENWRDMGLDPQYALTPSGFLAAAALYRMVKGWGQPRAAASPVALSQTLASPAAPAAGAAASISANPGGVRLPSGPPSNLDPAVANLIKGLDSAQLRDPLLGFAKNRPGR